MNFLTSELTVELINAFAVQMWLIFVAMSLAILVGVPLGVIASKFHRVKKIILSSTGILQVIPSLALLAFLIPVVGIGMKPAIIAIFLYALLPIVSNTLIGIEHIPNASSEAADALGFTSWQRLRLVEFPLALPYIINGIRVASIITVGTATLAAFVGAGGLGDFINRGLALNSTKLLLLGAIPAAILTLVLDYLIYQVELSLQINAQKKAKFRYLSIALLVMLFVGPGVFSLVHLHDNSDEKNTIKIATKNFTEQFILGEILKQLIENKTKLHVKLYSNLGGSEICFQALKNHQIDLYPDYTDVALLTQIHQPYVGVPREVVFKRAQQEYFNRYKILWLAPFGFNDSETLSVREDFAKLNHLETISDLVPMADHLRLGAYPEFKDRADGIQGLWQKYHLRFAKIYAMNTPLMFEAIANNKVDVIGAFGTDGRIPAYHIKILRDDKNLFPYYDCAPLMRLDTMQAHPELASVLALLANAIDDQAMRTLNAQVDMQKRSPAEVAHQFLLQKGLIKR